MGLKPSFSRPWSKTIFNVFLLFPLLPSLHFKGTKLQKTEAPYYSKQHILCSRKSANTFIISRKQRTLRNARTAQINTISTSLAQSIGQSEKPYIFVGVVVRCTRHPNHAETLLKLLLKSNPQNAALNYHRKPVTQHKHTTHPNKNLKASKHNINTPARSQ